MNQLSIEEGNKLIAEFMGAKYEPYPDGHFPGEFGYRFKEKMPATAYDTTEGWWWNKNALEFHTSWDWIMPVVEKIETLSYKYAGDMVKSHSVEIRRTHVSIMGYTGVRQDFMFYQTPYGTGPKSKLKAVWDACVQFIQFYNTTKSNQS